MNGTHLAGLEGTNPLGFLAALGVQVAFASELEQPRLWWSDDVTPYAVVDDAFSVERIAECVLHAFAALAGSPSMTPKRSDGSPMPKGDELKLSPSDMRTYLREAHASNSRSALPLALVAEGSLDNQGVAKPSDLYFVAGQMKFLDMARKILAEVSREDILAGIEGPWLYNSKLPSLKWDVSDDRVYALRSDDPSKDKKPTNPGVEALAILGLSLHPVFAGQDRTLTQGCSGKSWKESSYAWPLWDKPASLHAVKSLLAHASHPEPTATNRHRWFRSWGVAKIFQSSIHRSDQGGYGTFGPPEIAWQGQSASAQPRSTAWKRLMETISSLGAEASANGLTDAELQALLADES